MATTEELVQKLSPEARAYIAGIIDGEGYLQVKSNGGVELRITNASEDLIRRLTESIGGCVKIHYNSRYNANANDLFRMSIYGRASLAAVLEAVEPYLIVKRERAKLLHTYCCTPRGPERDAIFAALRAEKQRGR